MKKLVVILFVFIASAMFFASCEETHESVEPKNDEDSVYIYRIDDKYYL